jgi:hypothetical protein
LEKKKEKRRGKWRPGKRSETLEKKSELSLAMSVVKKKASAGRKRGGRSLLFV